MYVPLNNIAMCMDDLVKYVYNNRDNKISTVNHSEAIKYFSLLTWIQLQVLSWLNIAQMNLFSRRQITVAVVLNVGWMGVKCKL